MVTQFITVEIDLKNLKGSLQDVIEARLKTQGEPLRWSITVVTQGMARVEAVILQNVNPQRLKEQCLNELRQIQIFQGFVAH